MSTPLSSLTPSRQNSRGLSPVSFTPKSEHGGMDEMMATNGHSENVFSSPLKTVVNEADFEPEEELQPVYSPGYESQEHNDIDEDVESIAIAPSSPFQCDGRDDTVDLQMMKQRHTSLGLDGQSATPRKRSYECIPEEEDEDEDLEEERYKKGMHRRDEPEINVYADEGASFHNETNPTESAGQETGHSMMEDKHNEGMSTVLGAEEDANDKENVDSNDANDDSFDKDDDDYDLHDTMDETCLSTFSAVPNADMTSFAKLRGESPTKSMRNFPESPAQASDTRSPAPSTPNTSKKPYMRNALVDMGSPIGSPTPRKRDARDIGHSGDTPNLLDLGDQSTFFPRKRYSMQNGPYSPSRRSPLRVMRESVRSPSKTSLLDFDIPPAPTPRSIPTVTPRELESLKSGFMSEISSLKATLSGKEAEVASLKQAVADAERRVGEALEEVRHEAASKETLEMEQVEWQRRGQEMEEVLQAVRADIVEGEREKERLMKKMDEVEKSKESLEGRIVELESQLAAARSSAPSDANPPTGASNTKTAEETANEVQDAVEKVARELHTLYKSKHETKVAALKKSYETRWEKRVREAEKKAKAANEETERLKIERDAAVSEASNPNASMIARENDDHEAERRVLEAQIKGLQQEMAAVKADSERMRSDLEMERAEKGELVAAVDEWLAMQQPPAPPSQQSSRPPSPQESTEHTTTNEEPVVEDFRRSIGRSGSSGSSGIRPPSTGSGAGERKIPKIPAPASRHARGNSGGKSGIAVFTPGRSGIMGSIERMGRGV